MRYISLMIAVAIFGFNGQALAFGDEPSFPTTTAAPKAKEPTLLEKVAKFKKEKTTLADVEKELGQPDGIMTMPDDTKRLQYSHVSLFGKSYTAVLFFYKNGVLKEIMTFQQ